MLTRIACSPNKEELSECQDGLKPVTTRSSAGKKGDLGAITSKGGPPDHMRASEKELVVLKSPLEQKSMFRRQERMLRRQEQQRLAKDAKIQRRIWDPGIKSIQDNTLRASQQHHIGVVFDQSLLPSCVVGCIDIFWPCDGSIDDLEVFGLRLEVDLGTVSRSVLGTCDELDAFVSIPDEGDMTFLRKKVKSGAAVGKLVLLQVFVQSRLIVGVFYLVDFSFDLLLTVIEEWRLGGTKKEDLR
ncbi:hypothetical protein Tco_0910628 [Tanacetum coccineum]|uniref:Uncharacterized protein n=1 Tax=Tanacetum coccineum TaxID=301880 RepID=A0ABQ5CTW3_9ASTR